MPNKREIIPIFSGSKPLTAALVRISAENLNGENMIGVTLYVDCTIGNSTDVTIAIKGSDIENGTYKFLPQESPESNKTKILGSIQEYDKDGLDFNQMFNFNFIHRVPFWQVYVKDAAAGTGVITRIVAVIETEV